MSLPACPVILGIDLDGEELWTGRDPANSVRPILCSSGVYEIREAMGDVLDLLNTHGVRATFFIPGATARRYPHAVRQIREGGHEIGSHGYTHRSPVGLSLEDERQELVSGCEALAEITGVWPASYRSPAWEFSPNTIPLLLEHGVRASANFMDSTAPYQHEVNGVKVRLVEVPVAWHLADAPYSFYGGPYQMRTLAAPSEVLEIWLEEFRGCARRTGSCFQLTLHPQLIGRPGRLPILDTLLREIQGTPGTRFMTVGR